MAEKSLTLNQQIALLPVAIPDSILDFLEDFNNATALSSESLRASIDEHYLQASGETLKADLDKLRRDMGKVIDIEVAAIGKEMPAAYLCKLNFEKGLRRLGIVTRMKDKTITKIFIQEGDYNEDSLKQSLK